MQPFIQKGLKPMRYKVFIAGAITNLPFDETYDKFFRIEQLLKSLGQEVVNPYRDVIPSVDVQSNIKSIIPQIFTCNAIYLLDDWHMCLFSNMAHVVAHMMGFHNINNKAIVEIRNTITDCEKKIKLAKRALT